MSLFKSMPGVITYKAAPSRRRLRWLAISSVAAGAMLVLAVAAVIYVALRQGRQDDSQRAKCLADGGRIVPVHGGKYDAWICDLPRNVEVRP